MNAAKQKAQDLAKQAAKAAAQQTGEVLQDFEEQVGLRTAPASQDTPNTPSGNPPNMDAIKQKDAQQSVNRLQALQAEINQIAADRKRKDEERYRQIRDPQAIQAEEEEAPPLIASKQGRQMKGTPGANRAQQRQMAELQSPERRSTPSQ